MTSTSFLEHEIPIVISSSLTSGAKNKSSDGSRFEVAFEGGFQIPKGSHNCTVAVETATVWWSVPNVITGTNDKFKITGPDTADSSTVYNLTIPQGLYNLSELNQTIQRELENAGAKVSPSPLIRLTADEATGKVEFDIDYTTVTVDLTAADSIGPLLGFAAATYGPYATAPQVVLAPNVAAFNSVNYFLLHSDMCDTGMRVNNTYNQTIAQVLIDVAPGSQIIATPNHPPKVACNNLVGSNRTHIRFWITDDQNRAVNTNGEDWSARLVLKYHIPFASVGK